MQNSLEVTGYCSCQSLHDPINIDGAVIFASINLWSETPTAIELMVKHSVLQCLPELYSCKK